MSRHLTAIQAIGLLEGSQVLTHYERWSSPQLCCLLVRCTDRGKQACCFHRCRRSRRCKPALCNRLLPAASARERCRSSQLWTPGRCHPARMRSYVRSLCGLKPLLLSLYVVL